MAVDPADMKLRSGNTGFVFSTGPDTITKSWEIYHEPTDIVVSSGVVRDLVMKVPDFADADARLEAQCNSALIEVRAQHAPIAEIGGFSAWDADLILDAWMQDEDGLRHPICGDIAQTPNDLVARINAILAARLPPPTWAWARPGGAGELQVKAVVVPGATSYNVYDEETLIGNVPDGGWQTIDGLSAGSYSVRIAGTDGVAVGILSFVIRVEVT